LKKFWLIFFILSVINISNFVLGASNYNPKILVITMNPYLEDKKMYAAEYIGYKKDVTACVTDLVKDIEYSSHGIVKCKIVKNERLDEFATYKCTVNLLDNTKSNRLDDKTWMKIMTNENGNISWYGSWDRIKEYVDTTNYAYDYGFDYDYIINKFNLIERRNKKEFDQVWLVTISPVNTYGSLMVGRSSYFINSPSYIRECDNFPIMNVSIERRDANLECFGNMTESILNKVFNSSLYSGYPNANQSLLKYEDLNLWEKFTLNSSTFKDKLNFYGVGNMHFPPNGLKDYDWSNENKVLSTWKDWRDNYPVLTGQTTPTNCNTWKVGNMDICRAHHRWWFSLLPHVKGVTSDGFSNNWWDYIVTLDYANNVVPEKNIINVKPNEILPNISFNVTYNSGITKSVVIKNPVQNFSISDKSIITFKNGKLKALKNGVSILKYYVDGKCGSITVNVSNNN
jgi:hypothetical protein